MNHIIIAANPKSGSRSRSQLVQELSSQLARSYQKVSVHTELSSLAEVIRLHNETGDLKYVIAAGGDGTVSAVANRTPAHVPIAVFPLGSENLLAQHYGWTCNPQQLAQRIEQGNTIGIDALDVHGHLALIMASIGFDADVVRRVHSHRTSHITRWAYRYHLLNAWFGYRWPKLKVSIHDEQSGESRQFEAMWIFVFNLPRYATGLKIIQNADPTDGAMNVGLFETSGRIRGLFQYLDVLRGRHSRRSDWKECLATSLTVERASSQLDHPMNQPDRLSLQYDGDADEPNEGSKVSIRVLPNRLRLVS